MPSNHKKRGIGKPWLRLGSMLLSAKTLDPLTVLILKAGGGLLSVGSCFFAVIAYNSFEPLDLEPGLGWSLELRP